MTLQHKHKFILYTLESYSIKIKEYTLTEYTAFADYKTNIFNYTVYYPSLIDRKLITDDVSCTARRSKGVIVNSSWEKKLVKDMSYKTIKYSSANFMIH